MNELEVSNPSGKSDSARRLDSPDETASTDPGDSRRLTDLSILCKIAERDYIKIKSQLG